MDEKTKLVKSLKNVKKKLKYLNNKKELSKSEITKLNNLNFAGYEIMDRLESLGADYDL